jgi:hypothetical protein
MRRDSEAPQEVYLGRAAGTPRSTLMDCLQFVGAGGELWCRAGIAAGLLTGSECLWA